MYGEVFGACLAVRSQLSAAAFAGVLPSCLECCCLVSNTRLLDRVVSGAASCLDVFIRLICLFVECYLTLAFCKRLISVMEYNIR